MKRITGVMVYYYFVCKRKLWFFSKDIGMEHNSELVGIGKQIEKEAYSRERKSILIDEVANIDFIKNWKIIHEVKKSKKIEIASIWQLKYYIYIVRDKGIEIEKGILDYPEIRKREEVFLSEEDIDKIKNIVEDIRIIIDQKIPEEKNKKPTCKKCSYYDLCYI